MRILFVTKPHLPAAGGAQLTTHFLAQELARRGHAITVFARQPPFDVPHSPRSSGHGYLVIHSAETSRDLRDVIREQAPDCVVVGGYHQDMATWVDTMLMACAPLPTILYVHDVGGIMGAPSSSPRAPVVAAVSRFVADQLAQQGIESTVVPPIVDRWRYQVPTLRRVALFINPVQQKGLERALSLAEARPDIPFAFVRCWHIPPADLARLRVRLQVLGNVELRDSVEDPARLYGDARVLLVPSTYPEAWGRVAAEAVAATIPVLAARVGGLPEAIGSGGILVDPDAPDDEWARQLSTIWDDPSVYEQCVARAEATAGTRHDTSSASAGAAFEELVERAMAVSG
jgi:glycosyltransferase involved in cell wall biosynthesis